VILGGKRWRTWHVQVVVGDLVIIAKIHAINNTRPRFLAIGNDLLAAGPLPDCLQLGSAVGTIKKLVSNTDVLIGVPGHKDRGRLPDNALLIDRTTTK
jgi:hypothetical protein